MTLFRPAFNIQVLQVVTKMLVGMEPGRIFVYKAARRFSQNKAGLANPLPGYGSDSWRSLLFQPQFQFHTVFHVLSCEQWKCLQPAAGGVQVPLCATEAQTGFPPSSFGR